MPFEPFLCISASAGSGKTFQLAHRYLRLLASGVPPDRIGAYTFSRKATGEIFDEIIRYLREAASTDEGASTRSKAIGQTRSRAQFLEDLRCVLRHLHRLRVGTLDSRIAQMLSACAVEIGLPPGISLMDSLSPQAVQIREQTLDSLFLPGKIAEESTQALLRLFDLATFGRSEKSFDRILHAIVTELYATYRVFPEAAAWEGPPVADPPRPLSEEELQNDSATIDHWGRSLEDNAVRDAVEKLVQTCVSFGPGTAWSDFKPPGQLHDMILAGASPLKFSRKTFEPPPEVRRALERLARHPLGVVWQRIRTQMPALHALLRVFDAAYAKYSLPRGQLTFEDASHLMNGFHQLTPGEIAYRLDGEIDHWLLDEFQDTSPLQWGAIEPFVAELLQDSTQRRTFFYVGDVKQAIYAWRGGAPDLFHRLRERWKVIQLQPLDDSYRSAPAVLELVNTLFGDVPPHDDLPTGAVERWNDEFRPHRAARPGLTGYATVARLQNKDSLGDELSRLLDQLPAGAEIAILTRTNEEGRKIANLLRAKGRTVVLEGVAPLRDDTAVEAVLAALRLAAHPADTFCRQLVRMAGLEESNAVSLLRDVQEHGFAHVVLSLSRALALPASAAFSRHRLAALAAQAAAFDARGDRSIDRFLAHIDSAKLREHEARGAIRIMTIHQSKGLGFDAVILPIRDADAFANVDTYRLVTSPPDESTTWVTMLPPAEVCAHVPELLAIRQRAEDAAAYESLCLLYVAMTRAKHALHVLLPPEPSGKTRDPSLNRWHNWIAQRLGTSDKFGQPNWHLPPAAAHPPEPPPTPFPLRAGKPILPRLEPSRADFRPERIDRFFEPLPTDGRDLGSRVHAILEKLEWAEDITADALLAAAGEPADSEAAGHVRRALERFAVLRRPPGATGLWREQRFETILDEGWITGIFDRVVLFADGAWIQDYKTNRRLTDDTLAHYIPQMTLYRRVLADMLNLPPANIRCQLLFTGAGELREI